MLLFGSGPLRADVTHVGSVMLEELLRDGVPIVDIRTPEEWSETGVIEGSHLITFFDAEGNYDARAWLAEFSAIAAPDEPVAIICQRGGRSSTVSRFLDARVGYERIHNVQRGIARWIAEGRPTVPIER